MSAESHIQVPAFKPPKELPFNRQALVTQGALSFGAAIAVEGTQELIDSALHARVLNPNFPPMDRLEALQSLEGTPDLDVMTGAMGLGIGLFNAMDHAYNTPPLANTPTRKDTLVAGAWGIFDTCAMLMPHATKIVLLNAHQGFAPHEMAISLAAATVAAIGVVRVGISVERVRRRRDRHQKAWNAYKADHNKFKEHPVVKRNVRVSQSMHLASQRDLLAPPGKSVMHVEIDSGPDDPTQ